MERVAVGLTAAALLIGSAECSRADYVSVCHLDGPSGGDEQSVNWRGFTVDPAGKVFFPNTASQHLEALDGGRLLLTNFGDVESAPEQSAVPAGMTLPTIGDAVSGDRQRLHVRPLTNAGTLLGDSANLGIGGLQLGNLTNPDDSLATDFFVADSIDRRGELSVGDEPYIARFGGLGIGDVPLSEPDRVVLSPSGNGSGPEKGADHKLAWVMSLVALGVLSTLGYMWRRRRRPAHRALRGPRRTTVYRAPSLPNPPGATP